MPAPPNSDEEHDVRYVGDTLALVVGTLLLVVFVACWIPALRAGKTDPARLLRAES